MKSSHPYRHFIRTFFWTFSGLAILVLFLNWFANPYGIFNSPQLPALNKQKPQAHLHQRLIKAIEIEQLKPKALLMGTSRTQAGMLPEHLEPFVNEKVYNLGLPSSTWEELYAYLEHALYNQPAISTIVVDMDMFMFNRNRKLNVEFDAKRLKQTAMTLQDYLDSLFTAVTLKNSLLTLKDNLSRYLNLSGDSIQADFDPLSDENKRFIKDISLASPWFGKYELDRKQVDYYAKFVQTCRERGIRLQLYFSPAHAMYWETIFQKQLWPIFENLKRELSQIHPFYDFSGYNAVTTRQCQKPGQSLYSDCSHYTPLVGRWILARLHEESTALNGFGLWMTPENIEAHLQLLREERQKWVDSNAETTHLIAELSKGQSNK